MKPLLISLLLLGSCAAVPPQKPAPHELVERILPSIVRIEFVIPGEAEFHVCTGFVISATRGEAITARHCVPEGLFYVDLMPSRLIRAHEMLAIVETVKMKKPPVTIRKDALRYGETLHTLGYAWGVMSVFQRQVSAFLDGHKVGIDGALAPGMSGGPVIDDMGRVVGLNQASSDRAGIISDGELILDMVIK